MDDDFFFDISEIPAPRILCSKGTHHLKIAIRRILGNGGEGVILQKRGSLYEAGRSSSLLKLKVNKKQKTKNKKQKIQKLKKYKI